MVRALVILEQFSNFFFCSSYLFRQKLSGGTTFLNLRYNIVSLMLLHS